MPGRLKPYTVHFRIFNEKTKRIIKKRIHIVAENQNDAKLRTVSAYKDKLPGFIVDKVTARSEY